MTPQHLCHAVDCNERVLPTRLMCGPHWFMVPEHLRRLVWKTYRPGQCDDALGIRPSPEWVRAAREAINHVAVLEGKPQLSEHAEIVKTLGKLISEHKQEKP